MTTDHRLILSQIRTFPALINYLRDSLDWPIESDDFEELTFEYTPEELQIDKANAAKIEEIKRLRPLATNQPWGIFFIKFEPKKLPVVALRRILNQVALKKRVSSNSAERQAWSIDDLLFISNYGEQDSRHITLAHFSQTQEEQGLPTLKVLGWDSLDTALHLDHVGVTLVNQLSWPEDESDQDAWRAQWRSAFTTVHREVIDTSKKLSVELAKLAQKIRKRINTVLSIETEDGPVTRLKEAFKKTLINDLEQDDFADMYAQTISYGLLSARIAGPVNESEKKFSSTIPVTNPFIRDLLKKFIEIGESKDRDKDRSSYDFDELGVSDIIEMLDKVNMEEVIRNFGDRNPNEDPVIHFYELFLKEYDPKKRIQKGVFFTPSQVVTFIVKSVHKLLQKEFGLEDGLADITTWGQMTEKFKHLSIPENMSPDKEFIQILDPATGTGTFLVEVIDVIYKTMKAKWETKGYSSLKINEYWNKYVTNHLLTRLHGYELLMAPYAIAHLKIGLKLYETGYRFQSEERLKVYLTDTLEPEYDFSGILDFYIPALAQEAVSVNEIKKNIIFTVVVGNPPYLREKEKGPSKRKNRLGGWIRHGDKNKIPIFNDFIDSLKQKGFSVHAKLAYELSVMFWRYAIWQVFEKKNKYGIVAFISPRAYIGGPGHYGMRSWIKKYCNNIWIADLEGDNRGARKSENIFQIETGVAIGIFSNSPKNKDSELTINYKLISNSAKAKLNYLNNNDIINILDWTKCDSYQDTFLPIASNKYSSWISLKNIFPWQHSGTQFKRLWPIAESKEVLVKRWKKLVALPKNQRAEAFIETDARLIADSLTGSKSRKYTGIENLNEQSSIPRIERYAYRSMDLQWCILDERVADRIRPPLVKVLGPKQVFGATLMTKPLGYGPSVSVTLYLPDMDIFCNRGAKDIFPLWKDSAGKVPNVTENLLSIISNIIGLKITPEFLFCYTVAILGSPNYFLSFENDLLSTDIKIPITKNSKIFSEGIKLGAELIWFQTFGERWLGVDINYNKKLVGKAKLEMEIPSSREAYPNKYEYNKELETLKVGDGIIINVVPEVYNYSLSGFKVIESWIKYRLSTKGGKAGKSKSRSPLDKIRPNSWIFTDELLRLLWSVEGCVNLWPKLGEFLNDVISDNYFISSELPEPSSFEKKEPHIDSEIQGILF